MPAAVTLTLDAAGTARVSAMWDALATEGHSASMPRLGYVPHLTLLVWPDEAADAIAGQLPAVASLVPPQITMATLGVAPGDPAVLWLGVVATQPLLALHAALAERIGHAPHPHYRIGAWMPHITLADDLAPARIGAAIACLAGLATADHARIAAIEAVSFPPVAVLGRHALSQAGNTRDLRA